MAKLPTTNRGHRRMIPSYHWILLLLCVGFMMFGIHIYTPNIESHPNAKTSTSSLRPTTKQQNNDSGDLQLHDGVINEVSNRNLKVSSSIDKTPYYSLSNGVKMPLLLYGTAWKVEKTKELTLTALKTGFRGIDTANQGRHYNEEGVGDALYDAIQQGIVNRKDIFLQTKFTFSRGHEPGQEPYNIHSSFKEQVLQSFQSSLKHLNTDYIDSYIIHGPYKHGHKLSQNDLEVYSILEQLYNEGKVKVIGISNFSAKQLISLISKVKIIPHVVQIRTFASKGWDDKIGGVYKICVENNIKYEAYSLLTANRFVFKNNKFLKIAIKYNITPQQLAFQYAFENSMTVLTGTTDKIHMKQDLDVQYLMNDQIGDNDNLEHKIKLTFEEKEFIHNIMLH